MGSHALVFGLALFAGCGSDAAPQPQSGSEASKSDGARPQPPNIILIVVDTLRADMVGPTPPEGARGPGSRPLAKAPALTALADESVVFRQAFSHAPMTLPSHAALFSSRPPVESHVLVNWQSVPADLPLLPQWLQRHGYQTHAAVSLASLDPKTGEVALDRGFDAYDRDYWHIDPAPRTLARLSARLDALDPERPFFLFAHFSDPHEPYNSHSEPQARAQVTLDGAPLADVTTSEMTQWVRELDLEAGRHVLEFESESDFILNHLQVRRGSRGLRPIWEEGQKRQPTQRARVAVDIPQAGPVELRFWIYAERGSLEVVRRHYLEEVEWLDTFLGQFLGELRSRNLFENSVLVFTSDHGEALGEHRHIGHVGNLHDELLHVPLFIRLPARSADRPRLEREQDRLVPLADVAPTLLELAGLPPLPGALGTSLLQDRTPLLLAQTHRPVAARDSVALRDEELKLIFWPQTDSFSLYDLTSDPHELSDVFAKRGGERESWQEELRAVARRAEVLGMQPGELDAEERDALEALGYTGDQ